MNKAEIVKKRASAQKRAQELAKVSETEGRRMTDAEMDEAQRLIEELRLLDAEIDAYDRSLSIGEELERLRDASGRRAVRPPQIPDTFSDWRANAMQLTQRVTVFRGPEAERNAYECGRWLMATMLPRDNPVQQSSFEYCCDRGFDMRAMGGGSNAAGGYLVPEAMSRSVIENREEYGAVRSNCWVWPMIGDTANVPISQTGPTAYFVSENAATTASDPTLGNANLTARSLRSLCRISSEINEDSAIPVAEFVTSWMAQAFAYAEDKAALLGDGTSANGGIYGLFQRMEDDSGLAGRIAGPAGKNTATEIVKDDLISLMALLPAYANRNAKFYVSQAYYFSILLRAATAAGGTGLGEMIGGPARMSFMGYPAVVSQVLPTSLTEDRAGKFLVGFGDLRRACVMGDRRTMSVRISDQRYFEYDQIAIQATERFDISCGHGTGTSGAAGPMVILVGGTA